MREPYRYREHPDNRLHQVTQNDTLASVAARYFAPLPRACGYWWVVADFQPRPIVNPLAPLYPTYRTLVVPSARVLHDLILSGIGAGHNR